MATEEENKRKNNLNLALCSNYSNFLLEVIEFHYLNRNKKQEKEDKDQWTNSKSASLLLHYLSRIGNLEIIEFVYKLFQNYFSSEDLYIKDSVIMAFGSILDTIHLLKIKELIMIIFPYLLNLFEEKTIFIRCTSAWAISKICEKHIDCVITLNNNKEFCNNFLELLFKNINSLKRLANYFMECLIQIPEQSYKYNEKNSVEKILKTSILSSQYDSFMRSLLNLCTKNQNINEYNFSANSFFALSQMIEFCPLDVIDDVNNFFSELINIFDWVNLNILNKETKYFYQENIFSLILIYLMKEKINFTEEQYLYLFQICENSLIEREVPFISGIYLLGNLLKISNKNELNYLICNNEKFIRWIFLGLSNWEDKDLCQASIETIGDLMEKVPIVIYPYMENILDKVFEIGKVK